MVLFNRDEKEIFDKMTELYELIKKLFKDGENGFDMNRTKIPMRDIAASLREVERVLIIRALRRHILEDKDIVMSANYVEGSPEIDDDPDVIDL